MMMNGIGDLARHMTLGRQHSALKTQLDRLTQELASGQRTDVGNPVTGGYLLLGDLARSETLLQGYTQNVAEARLYTNARQTVLENMQSMTKSLASDLLVSHGGTHETREVLSNHAHETFRDLVSSLNGRVAGKGLFSGTDTNGVALAPADEMLAALRTEIAGATSSQDVRQTVISWFNGPDFATSGYLGNDEPEIYQLSETDRVSTKFTANSPEIVALLAETAIAALATDVPGLGTDQSQELMSVTGQALINAQQDLTSLRANLGVVQERIDLADTRNATQLASMQLARSELVAIDPFETATTLEHTRLQLETLYTVTARLSGLTLASYLR